MKSISYRLLSQVSIKINEETILPRFSLYRTGFNPGHTQTVKYKVTENIVQCTTLMGHFKTNADFIRTFLEYFFMADNDKARKIIIQII